MPCSLPSLIPIQHFEPSELQSSHFWWFFAFNWHSHQSSSQYGENCEARLVSGQGEMKKELRFDCKGCCSSGWLLGYPKQSSFWSIIEPSASSHICLQGVVCSFQNISNCEMSTYLFIKQYRIVIERKTMRVWKYKKSQTLLCSIIQQKCIPKDQSSSQ